MRSVTKTSVKALYAWMKKHYGSEYVNKRSAKEMEAVGWLLDALGILDKNRFLQTTATTVGRRIYLPFTPGASKPSLLNQVLICAHEHQHVEISDRYTCDLKKSYELAYIGSTAQRALIEAECYRTNLEVLWWYSRAVEKRNAVVDYARVGRELQNSYGCKEADANNAVAYLEKAYKQICRGAVSTVAAKDVISFFGWGEAPEIEEE